MQTAEEAKAELRADGIDPDAAAARMIAKVRGGVAIDKLGKAMIAFDLLDACLSDRSMSTGGRVVAAWKVVQEALKICAMPPALAAAPLPAQPTPNVRPGCTSCDGDGCFFCAGAPATPAQPTPALEPVRASVNAAVKRWANDTRDDRTVPRVVDDAFEEYALKAPPTPAQPTEEVRRLRERIDAADLAFAQILSVANPTIINARQTSRLDLVREIATDARAALKGE